MNLAGVDKFCQASETEKLKDLGPSILLLSIACLLAFSALERPMFSLEHVLPFLPLTFSPNKFYSTKINLLHKKKISSEQEISVEELMWWNDIVLGVTGKEAKGHGTCLPVSLSQRERSPI